MDSFQTFAKIISHLLQILCMWKMFSLIQTLSDASAADCFFENIVKNEEISPFATMFSAFKQVIHSIKEIFYFFDKIYLVVCCRIAVWGTGLSPAWKPAFEHICRRDLSKRNPRWETFSALLWNTSEEKNITSVILKLLSLKFDWQSSKLLHKKLCCHVTVLVQKLLYIILYQ